MKPRSLWLLAAVCCATSFEAAAASAEDDVCTRAYVETQRLQRAAQFRAARQQAVACGQDTCSATVRVQCNEWLESIERGLPTLVIDARDGGGAALADVRVEANGELLVPRLNGRALELDPGEYVLRFRYGKQVIEQHTLIRESEKYRTLEVHFSRLAEASETGLGNDLPSAVVPVAPVAPPLAAAALVSQPAADDASRARLPSGTVSEQDTTAAIPTGSYILGGLGLASLTTFALVASNAYAQEQHLRKTCAGACESGQVDAVRARYMAADVALGVGVSSLVAALAVWLWAPDDISASSRLSISPHRVALAGEF